MVLSMYGLSEVCCTFSHSKHIKTFLRAYGAQNFFTVVFSLSSIVQKKAVLIYCGGTFLNIGKILELQNSRIGDNAIRRMNGTK